MTYGRDSGEVGLPLPLGIELPKHTVNADSVVSFMASEFETVDSTEQGWPTLVVGTDNDLGERLGVAIDYLGIWHDSPIQEADLVLGSDQKWWIVVAFQTTEHAVDHASYKIDDYAGYEFIDRPDYMNMEFEGS